MRAALSDYQHLASGKVRELYRVDDEHLLLVATDRISAYDYVLASTIPDKGRILTAMSVFFFGLVDAPNHLAGPPDDPRIPDEVLGRALVVWQLEMLPVECVARGYLTGSGLLDYQATGKVCGIALPAGLVEASKFAEPLFTPATKAALGDHDENISFGRVIDLVGEVRANQLRDRTLGTCSGRGSRPEEGNHHRGHQVRIRHRPRRQPAVGRRNLYPGFIAILAGRGLPGRRGPDQLRQAIRPQLAHQPRIRLGPLRYTTSTTASGPDHRVHPRPLYRGLRTHFQPGFR